MELGKLLEIVKRRGLSLELKDGQPVLSGPKDKRTPALVSELKANRDAIIKRLGGVKYEEWYVWYEDDSVVRMTLKEDYDSLPFETMDKRHARIERHPA